MEEIILIKILKKKRKNYFYLFHYIKKEEISKIYNI